MVSAEEPKAHAPFPFRRLLRLIRPELRNIVLGMIFLAIGSAMNLLFPQGIRILVDDALAGGQKPTRLDAIALGMLVIFLIQGIAVALRSALFTISGERTVARLREELFARILEQEVAFFDERKTGELLSRLSSDATTIQLTVSIHVSMALRFFASVVGGLGFLFYTSPKLTLIMLLVVPAVALGAVAYGRRVRKLSLSVQDALAKSSEAAEEALAGIRTVRAFAAEPNELGRYESAVQRAFSLARTRTVATATFMGGASFAGYGAAALVFWYGGRMVASGAMSIGALTSFLVYTLLVAFSLGGLSDLWGELMKAGGAATRIFEILDRAPRIPPRGGMDPERVEGQIAFEKVFFSYPMRKDLPVLKGLDLSIRPGEIVALVGPSGAGKSTISSLLLRLYDPNEGRILLDGRDLRELDPNWLRRRIGVVSQEPILFSGSIAENIRYGRPEASEAEVEAAARAANAHEFITRFPKGYDTLVGERGVQLSGGQKQRVAIARALLKDPPLLILDEATSALDAESEHLVKEALDRLMAKRTTLIIAHRLSTVRDANRVLVLDGGRVVQSGDHTELVAEEGLYRRLVERQFVAAS